jgi:hypothetical protein
VVVMPEPAMPAPLMEKAQLITSAEAGLTAITVARQDVAIEKERRESSRKRGRMVLFPSIKIGFGFSAVHN